MSDLSQLKLLAEYNQLMNQRLFAAASMLSEEDLKKDCHVFFHSVIGTLNHIMVGDIVWLKRFAEHPSSQASLAYMSTLEIPESLASILYPDMKRLNAEREKLDSVIVGWINSLLEGDLNVCIGFNNMAGEPFKKQYSSLIHHLFLHQTHHRGQVSVLMSQFGIDFGDTDIIEIIDECSLS